MKTTPRITLFATALAIVTTSSAIAHHVPAPTLVVRSKGLDLKTEQGMRTMYARIEHAAEQLCSNIVTAREMLGQRRLLKKCVNDATSNAVARLEDGTFRRYAQNRLDSHMMRSRG